MTNLCSDKSKMCSDKISHELDLFRHYIYIIESIASFATFNTLTICIYLTMQKMDNRIVVSCIIVIIRFSFCVFGYFFRFQWLLPIEFEQLHLLATQQG
jgi:hypothetical protein